MVNAGTIVVQLIPTKEEVSLLSRYLRPLKKGQIIITKDDYRIVEVRISQNVKLLDDV